MTIAPDVRIEGETVRLRQRREEDLALFVRWYNDPEVRHWLHMSEAGEQTIETERQRWELTRHDPTRITFVIETRDGVAIGNVGLIAIEEAHGRAELGVSIGDKDHWNRGYGTDAIRTLLGFAFETMGLRRVELITDHDNERGLRCYEKCGFVREGVLRAHRLRYGKPLDMVLMSVLREDWGR
jgi:RimJ/RimL family protein N-acetyltransferase